MNTVLPPSPRAAGAESRRLSPLRRTGLALAPLALLALASPLAAQPPVAVTSRHAPTLNGRVEGSFQVLLPESFALNSSAALQGDLLVPGTPRVVVNGHPAFAGTLDGSGSAQPTSHTVTINGGASLGSLRRRTDAAAMPAVPVPPASAGTRSVSVNSPGQSVGDWNSLRDLTLNSNVGAVSIPAGTYRNFTANGGTSLVLGIAGAAQASVYNFEQITLNGASTLQVVGPVVMNLANRLLVHGGMAGSPAHPEWLALNVARYEVTLNGGAALHGTVRVPAGTVTVNGGTLAGNVAADRVVLNGNGTIRGVETPPQPVPDTTPPILRVVLPLEGAISDSTTVLVSGSVEDASAVGVLVGGVLAYSTGGSFSRQVDLADGTQTIRVVATDAAGNSTEVVRTVTVDTTPPVFSELSPTAGSAVPAGEVTVTGRVTDVTAVTVRVGAVTATVGAGGAFRAERVPLAEGDNEIVLSAVDAAGNSETAALVLTGRDVTPPPTPFLFPLAERTRETRVTLVGRADPGSTVTVSGGSEPASALAAEGTGLFVAVADLAPGANALALVVVDGGGNASPPARLTITSDPAAPLPPAGQSAHLAIGTGDAQRGLAGSELPRPLIAVVKDRNGAPVAGVPVTFSLLQGGGRFVGAPAGADSVVIETGEDGYARARYVCGAEPGPQLVRADMAGNLFAPTDFGAEALAPLPGGRTTVSGRVLDVNLRALPNVLVRLGGQQARTGADGRFRIAEPPAGPHQLLELIGRDQVPYPGRWPNISYDLDVVAGIDNQLGRPLYLPKVNDGVAMPLDGTGVVTQDTSTQILVAGGEPPVRITARAGTRVTFPPDATDKRLSVTRIPADRIPMPLEDGRATNLYISVQPAGALFDPPLAVSFPNLDHQAPGAEVLLMSFDHDAGRYVQVGTARVSADGRTVESLPGGGIRVGAWHAAPPDPPGRQVTAVGALPVAASGGSAFAAPGSVTLKAAESVDMVGKHIVDLDASIHGTTASPMTPRSIWHDSAQVLFRATFYIQGDAPPPPVQLVVNAQLSQAAVTLESVTFKDNYDLKRDTGEQKSYESPEWTATAATDPAYKGAPIAYTQNKAMKVEATFGYSTDVVKGTKALGKVDGSESYDIASAKVSYDNATKKAKLEGTSVGTKFAENTIGHFPAMNLKWSVALDGVEFTEAGVSSHQIYVTLERPSPAYLTLVDLATRDLGGKKRDEKAAIVAAIWSKFTGRAVKRVIDDHPLTYWGPTATADSYDTGADNTTKGLLRIGDGRCGSWHSFFTDTLKVQGINDAKPSAILPKPKSGYGPCDVGLFVGHGYWVSANDSLCQIGRRVGQQSPGQNMPMPGSDSFTDHAVVVYQGRIYDPSYGRDFADIKAWEDASLDYTSYRKPDGRDAQNNPKFKDCRFIANTAAQETDLYDDTAVPVDRTCQRQP